MLQVTSVRSAECGLILLSACEHILLADRPRWAPPASGDAAQIKDQAGQRLADALSSHLISR